MTSLTIQVPIELLDQLRQAAEGTQTSLDDEVIRLLEWALAAQRRRAFLDALQAFRAADGDFDEDPDALFGDLRSPDWPSEAEGPRLRPPPAWPTLRA